MLEFQKKNDIYIKKKLNLCVTHCKFMRFQIFPEHNRIILECKMSRCKFSLLNQVSDIIRKDIRSKVLLETNTPHLHSWMYVSMITLKLYFSDIFDIQVFFLF